MQGVLETSLTEEQRLCNALESLLGANLFETAGKNPPPRPEHARLRACSAVAGCGGSEALINETVICGGSYSDPIFRTIIATCGRRRCPNTWEHFSFRGTNEDFHFVW